MELRRNGQTVNDSDSLIFTNYKTTDPFISVAESEYRKKQLENRKLLIEEIERRNIEGAYDV